MWRKGLCVVLIGTLLSACATTSGVQSSPAPVDEALRASVETVLARGATSWIAKHGPRDMKVLPFFYSAEGDKQRVSSWDRQMALAVARQLPRAADGINVIPLEEDALAKIIEEIRRAAGDLFQGILDQGRLTPANVALIGTTFLYAKRKPVEVEIRLVDVEDRQLLGSGDKITLPPPPRATWCEEHSPWCWLLGVGGVLAAGAIAAIALSSGGSSSRGGAGGAGGQPPP